MGRGQPTPKCSYIYPFSREVNNLILLWGLLLFNCLQLIQFLENTLCANQSTSVVRLWTFRPPMCNPKTLVLHKAKEFIQRRCLALEAIKWWLWNYVPNILSLFLLTLWKWLYLVWMKSWMSPAHRGSWTHLVVISPFLKYLIRMETFLSNLWVKNKLTMKLQKYFKLNNNGNTTHQNYKMQVKQCLEGNF